MKHGTHRPALRPVETIVVPDREHGRVLVLRDTEGIATGSVCIPPPLIPVVARFTGERTCEEIAEELSRELGDTVDPEVVVRTARTLEEALFLDGPAYRAARGKVVAAFATAPVREASHAGGAYYKDPEELRVYVEKECLAKASEPLRKKNGARMVALVSPHIDPWRGATCYGHAYAALAAGIAPEVDTFLVLGTSHAPIRRPFALCKKAFDTPFGAMPCDEEAVDRIARAATFDPYADQLNHKREHSIEFQVVFLKHLIGQRPARIIPILAGLGEQQSSGKDPHNDAAVRRFVDAVREVVQDKGRRVVVVAGADMAHVGPRFGDPKPFDAPARARLAGADRASLSYARESDPRAFWRDVSSDLDTRRVCGLAPIYTLLETLPEGARGDLLHYEQTVDDEDGSIVSHAALGFYA